MIKIIHFYLEKDWKDTIVNLTYHSFLGGSLEIMSSVLLELLLLLLAQATKR